MSPTSCRAFSLSKTYFWFAPPTRVVWSAISMWGVFASIPCASTWCSMFSPRLPIYCGIWTDPISVWVRRGWPSASWGPPSPLAQHCCQFACGAGSRSLAEFNLAKQIHNQKDQVGIRGSKNRKNGRRKTAGKFRRIYDIIPADESTIGAIASCISDTCCGRGGH